MLDAMVAGAIFLVSLALIMSEKIERTIVAISGSAVMVAAGLALGFYSEEEALAAIDFDTLGLLLGMMLVVALLEPTGFFQYVAVKAGQLSQGKPWRLMVLLCLSTTLVSMFLNNVTTIVLIAPVTIMLSEILGLSPTPFLMAEAMLANTAGVATSVGDPASVLVSNAGNLSFNDFLTHSLPIVAVSILVAFVMLRILFRAELSTRPTDPAAFSSLDPAEALQDPHTASRVLIILAGTVTLFFFQAQLHISSAFIALMAAAAALAWLQPDTRDVLHRIDLDVLLFFTGLFGMVGGLDAAGILDIVANIIAKAGLGPVWLGVAIIWIVAVSSALVDNIPITIAMIGVLQGMARAGVDVSALWWAVVFGAGFGGNGTIIGSTASVMVVSISKRTRTPITAALWTRRGLPIMLVTCTVTSILYALLLPWLAR